MKLYPLSEQGECEVSVDIHDRAPFVALGLRWRFGASTWLSPDEARAVAKALNEKADELENMGHA
jgi:hypothetical protein